MSSPESGGHHGHGPSKEEVQRALQENAARKILEVARRQPLPEHILKRLEMDLGTNATADYSRINLTEVFMAFDFDVRATVTQWRIAKVMDAMAVCHDELGIKMTRKSESIDPTTREKKVEEKEYEPHWSSLPKIIYESIELDQINQPKWKIQIKSPKKEGETHDVEVSLADIAHFMDILKTNRELGTNRFSVNELVYNYFTRQPLRKEVVDGSGAKRILDLNDEKFNPKDDFKGIDMPGYKDRIKNNQTSLQMLGDWRFTSDKHREVAGHAFLVTLDGTRKLWVPMSGEMAQQITWEDMQKQSEKGPNSSLAGQPQELGDMDEKETGAIVRFRYRFLKQRRQALNPSQISGATSRRMAKAMVGQTMLEEPEVRRETVNGEETSVIWLFGKELNTKIIKAMGTHYNDARTKMGLPPLSKEEASDMAFVDIIAPCFLNSPTDWLVALNKAYNVSPQPNTIINSKVFPGFVLKVKARDYTNGGKIGEVTFRSVKDLSDYINDRLDRGDIEQGPRDASDRGTLTTEKDDARVKPQETLTAVEAEGFTDVMKALLGADYKTKLAAYVGGDNSVIDEIVSKFENTPVQELYEILKVAFPQLEEEGTDDEEADTLQARDSFIETLKKLPPEERKKLENPAAKTTPTKSAGDSGTPKRDKAGDKKGTKEKKLTSSPEEVGETTSRKSEDLPGFADKVARLKEMKEMGLSTYDSAVEEIRHMAKGRAIAGVRDAFYKGWQDADFVKLLEALDEKLEQY